MSEWFKRFKGLEGVHFLGWAILLAAEGTIRGETAAQMRERLMANGASRSQAYRVLQGLREFAEDLRARGLWLEEWQDDGPPDPRAIAAHAVHALAPGESV